MMEVELMKIDDEDKSVLKIGCPSQKRRPPKRKRLEPCLDSSSPEEKRAKVTAFRDEINSLLKYCKELVSENRGALMENAEKVGNFSLNGAIACLLEESDLPLSKLVDVIFEEVRCRNGNGNGNGDGISKASVKSTVLLIGQRLSYGVTGADADVLEDEDEGALWCWETRDLKLIPKSWRVSLNVRRTCRRKIHDRIIAVSAMINALEMSEGDPKSQQELMKASEKLCTVLDEADVRLLMESMLHKNGAEMAEKEVEREGKLLIKQMEKKKKEMEKERKKVDRELQREKLQSEKEQKRLHDEAEKEERRREKEENGTQKQLKRLQEEAEKDKRRREKEEAELKRRLALQKQASLMERFLKRNNSNKAKTSPENESSLKKATTSGPSDNGLVRTSESVTLAMDSVLTQNDEIELEGIWKLHLNAWHLNRCSAHSNRNRHWGIRQKPKTELFKELKLTTNKELTCDEDLKWEDSNDDDKGLSQMTSDNSHLPCSKKRVPVKQLLQFDKSHRPAFYGVWPRKSQVVRGRRPFVKDSDIEYEIDSDEEWAEDEPGESLSDCDKDDEDEMEEHPMDEDEDENEDGFFVPDGYLSENEGVKADDMTDHDLVEEVRDGPTSEEFCSLLRQQKYLSNLTERALKKNQPLIILNLMHEKTTLLSAEELTGTAKLERMALQSLSLRPLPGFSDIEISVPNDVAHEDLEPSSNKLGTTPTTQAAILDSDLPQIISIIQSSPHGIGKIEKLLHNKFPTVPKSHLRNKVREISEFSDNRWRVKKEILNKHGLSTSPEKSCLKTKSISTFLKKRCHPPPGTTTSGESSASQSSQKLVTIVEPQLDRPSERL